MKNAKPIMAAVAVLALIGISAGYGIIGTSETPVTTPTQAITTSDSLNSGRASLAQNHSEQAAREFYQAGLALRQEAAESAGQAQQDLLYSATELENLCVTIAQGEPANLQAVDEVRARADYALAADRYREARAAWKEARLANASPGEILAEPSADLFQAGPEPVSQADYATAVDEYREARTAWNQARMETASAGEILGEPGADLGHDLIQGRQESQEPQEPVHQDEYASVANRYREARDAWKEARLANASPGEILAEPAADLFQAGPEPVSQADYASAVDEYREARTAWNQARLATASAGEILGEPGADLGHDLIQAGQKPQEPVHQDDYASVANWYREARVAWREARLANASPGEILAEPSADLFQAGPVPVNQADYATAVDEYRKAHAAWKEAWLATASAGEILGEPGADLGHDLIQDRQESQEPQEPVRQDEYASVANRYREARAAWKQAWLATASPGEILAEPGADMVQDLVRTRLKAQEAASRTAAESDKTRADAICSGS